MIGHQKFAYDVWGDAVNVSSRLESTGEPGRVHVSSEVRKTLGDRFDFDGPREVLLKGKGVASTWFLSARPPGGPTDPT